MNIFYLHGAPDVAATMMHDKHVVKMVLETAQILSAVYARYGKPAPYRATHSNHPSVLWAGDTVWQYQWLVAHGKALCAEYTHRYGRVHKSQEVIDALAAPPMHTAGWTQPPQCMPDEFRDTCAITAYRKYYLGAKVVQSKWTRRPVPAFVLNGEYNMAKKAPKTETPVAVEAPVVVAAAEAKEPAVRTRGPRGVDESAVITLLTETNPKREGSKAHAAFSNYRTGMTVGEFADAVGKEATGHLVYDAKHGFISIDGYNPGEIIQPKPKAEKVAKEPKEPKEPKAPKAKKSKADPVQEAEVEQVAEAEVMD